MAFNRFAFQVTINSYNDYGELEWTAVVRAGSHAAAMRKAWRVVRDCGADRADAQIKKELMHSILNLGKASL